MARDRRREPVTDVPPPSDRIELVRDIVYDEAGELLDPDDLEASLEAHGVTVSEDEDGNPVYRDVPDGLSLSACHLSVELREDPETFLGTGGG